MGLMNEYITRRLTGGQLLDELQRLIRKHNKMTDSYMLVYSAGLNKPVPAVPLSMDDYYIIADIISSAPGGKLNMYVETPGGSGEAAEEIVNCIHAKFDHVNFIVTGEAKSAGTLLVLSGNSISMTQTGSLGPVDAQIPIGRGRISAHDYMEWVNEKQAEAIKQGRLSPFDATMIAQISPGELKGVNNALEFAHDLVVKWLPQYKFRDWNVTETKKTNVTSEMRSKKARDIAKALTNHSKWRSHGRSLKIQDLESIGLKIDLIDDSPKESEIVYRIQVVLRLLFSTTNIYKIFATANDKITASATEANAPIQAAPSKKPSSANAEVRCPQCGKLHRLYVKFEEDTTIDQKMKKAGIKKLPKDTKLVCECGFEMDLSGMKNEIETNIGRRVVE